MKQKGSTMRTKLPALLGLLGVLLPLTLTLATAPADAATRCRTKTNAAQGFMSIDRGYGGGPNIGGVGEMFTQYRACQRPGKDTVQPTGARFNFYPSGKHKCDAWNMRRIPGVSFKPYYWGGARNYTRPAAVAKCRRTGVWTTGWRTYSGITLYPADGPSKFRAHMTGMVEGWADTSDSTSVARLWPY